MTTDTDALALKRGLDVLRWTARRSDQMSGAIRPEEAFAVLEWIESLKASVAVVDPRSLHSSVPSSLPWDRSDPKAERRVFVFDGAEHWLTEEETRAVVARLLAAWPELMIQRRTG